MQQMTFILNEIRKYIKIFMQNISGKKLLLFFADTECFEQNTNYSINIIMNGCDFTIHKSIGHGMFRLTYQTRGFTVGVTFNRFLIFPTNG